jgi:hypothetical protein
LCVSGSCELRGTAYDLAGPTNIGDPAAIREFAIVNRR